MTLASRLVRNTALLLLGTLLVGSAALVGLGRLSRHFDVASQTHEELRRLYEIGHHAASLRELLSMRSGADANTDALRAHAAAAMRASDALAGQLASEASLDEARRSGAQQLHDQLREIARRAHDDAASPIDSRELSPMLARVANLAGRANARIVENRAEAAAGHERTILRIGALFLLTIAAGAVGGVMHHRRVMSPLRALGQAVAHLVQARFGRAIPETGDRELRLLIRHFNHMSDRIGRLHETMRSQVEIKSRQLVRCEQLAGVGCLAAGVAHEINNPLAIIAGYAETTLRRLERLSDDDLGEPARLRQSLRIICDEAFRCRGITDELLELARPREHEEFEPISLAAVARRAIELVGALAVARGKDLVLCDRGSTFNASETLVRGDESQLLQVLINLLTNALDACESAGGRVVLSIEHGDDDDVLLTVADNGCGMSEETAVHVFDPFFSRKVERGRGGAGMGLAVSHAIIQRHGGNLFAHSDGPGRGSSFAIELPALHARQVLHACA